VRKSVRPGVTGSGPAELVLEHPRGVFGVTLEVNFNVVANPMSINSRSWWSNSVQTLSFIAFLKLLSVPEVRRNAASHIVKLEFFGDINPRPCACLSSIVSFSDPSEVTVVLLFVLTMT
jgi:hypothetical protein